MAFLARGGLVRRLVDAVHRGRTPVVVGGPGTGKTVVAGAAAALLSPGVGVVEFSADQALDAEILEKADRRPCIFVGGLELHRALEAQGPACRIAGGTVQRFPLVPLTRRQTLAWAQATGGRPLPGDEFEPVFRATGGHPSLIAGWLEERGRGASVSALTDLLLVAFEPLFARIDQALESPELAGLYAWLEQNGPARVDALRAAVGAEKGAIDRLVMAGPVSRTLGEAAEIAIGCGLYVQHRDLQP
ncbi:MAG: hypothetical protein ACKVUT_04805 [Gaiella sp.]